MKKLYQRWCIKNAIKYCCAIMILVIVSLNTTNVDARPIMLIILKRYHRTKESLFS